MQVAPLFMTLMERALELIRGCDCARDSGCPGCVQHTECGVRRCRFVLGFGRGLLISQHFAVWTCTNTLDVTDALPAALAAWPAAYTAWPLHILLAEEFNRLTIARDAAGVQCSHQQGVCAGV